MLIACPYCGARDSTEFNYLGDAACVRPDPEGPAALERFVEAFYLRDNPAGLHREWWYHAFGCRSWLRVTRDTRTHEVSAVEYAQRGSDP